MYYIQYLVIFKYIYFLYVCRQKSADLGSCPFQDPAGASRRREHGEKQRDTCDSETHMLELSCLLFKGIAKCKHKRGIDLVNEVLSGGNWFNWLIFREEFPKWESMSLSTNVQAETSLRKLQLPLACLKVHCWTKKSCNPPWVSHSTHSASTANKWLVM